MLLQSQKVFSIKHYHWTYTVKWKEYRCKNSWYTSSIPRSREQPQ